MVVQTRTSPSRRMTRSRFKTTVGSSCAGFYSDRPSRLTTVRFGNPDNILKIVAASKSVEEMESRESEGFGGNGRMTKILLRGQLIVSWHNLGERETLNAKRLRAFDKVRSLQVTDSRTGID